LTGARRWSHDAGSSVSSSPAVAAGLVLFGTYDGRFLAVDARTGALRWRMNTGALVSFPWGHESGHRYTSSPTIIGNVAVFGGGDGYVYAVDVPTGKTRWRSRTDGR